MSDDGRPSMSDRTKCIGPIWFGDHGIESCEACGGDCICCDAAELDHSGAAYECFTSPSDGRCHLKKHAGRSCTQEIDWRARAQAFERAAVHWAEAYARELARP